jgi:hypothetical protein
MTHGLLTSWLDHLDRQLVAGDNEQRQRALVLRGQVQQLRDRLELRQRQGRGFDEKETHILEHIVPTLRNMPLR